MLQRPVDARSVSARVLGVALALSMGGCGHTANDEAAEPRLAGTAGLPDAPWVDVFFRTFDRVTNAAGLKSLREEVSRVGDREIRVWIGGGVGYPQDLYRIADSAGIVTGELVRYWPVRDMTVAEGGETVHDLMLHNLKGSCDGFVLQDGMGICRALFTHPPDWAALLERAEAGGLWTLPDPSTLPPTSRIQLDGSSMAVELRDGESYKAYLYSFPLATQAWPEGEKALGIARDFRNTVRSNVRTPEVVQRYRGVSSGKYGSGFLPCHGTHEWQFRGEVLKLAELASLPIPTLAQEDLYYLEVQGQLYPEWVTRNWKTEFSRVLHPMELLDLRPWTGLECDEDGRYGT